MTWFCNNSHIQHHFLLSLDVDLKLLLFFKFIYFNWRLLLYNIVFVLPYINMNLPQVYMCSPSWIPLPLPFPYHSSGSFQCTSPRHPVSCIKPGLVIHFIYDSIHVSMPFSQIIPPLPSPTESKRLWNSSCRLGSMAGAELKVSAADNDFWVWLLRFHDLKHWW